MSTVSFVSRLSSQLLVLWGCHYYQLFVIFF